jgi:hypothetical protein
MLMITDEQINQFLTAGNGPMGHATYRIFIMRKQYMLEYMRLAHAGNTTAIMLLNVIEGFLARKLTRPLCGACDSDIDEHGHAMLVLVPGLEPKKGDPTCVMAICPNCAALDDAELLAKAEPYLGKLWPGGRRVGAAEISCGSGSA